jgi:hypothetical protein
MKATPHAKSTSHLGLVEAGLSSRRKGEVQRGDYKTHLKISLRRNPVASVFVYPGPL